MDDTGPYRAEPAPPAEVEKLQREWLSKAKRNKAPDILEYARLQGEKLHDANLKTLEREVAQVLAKPDAESELRGRYHYQAMHRNDADPVYAALKGFLATTGADRARVEELALEYLCEESRYLDRAKSETGDRRDTIIRQAEQERQKGLAALEKSKANQRAGTVSFSRKPPSRTKWTPVTLRRLRKTVEEYHGKLTQWVRQFAETEESDIGPTPEPDIRFDTETLLKFVKHDQKDAAEIPADLHVLIKGPEGDQAILQTSAATKERERSAELQRRWNRATDNGARILMLLKGINGKAELLMIDEAEETVNSGAAEELEDALERHDTLRLGTRYQRASLERLSEEVNGHRNLEPEALVTLEGEEGREARLKAIADGEREREEEETRLENDNGLTPAQRVERRSHWMYTGPKLGWNLAKLQEVWASTEGEGRMPREWYRQALDVVTEELELRLLDESRAADDLQACQEKVQYAIRNNHTPGIRSTRRKEARQASELLEQTIALTDAAFRQAGVKEPPPRIRPGVEESPDKAEEDVSKPQMAMPLTGITVMEPRPRLTGQRKGQRRTKQEQTPQVRMAQLL